MEAALQRLRARLEETCEWLKTSQHPEVVVDQKHLDEGSTEQAYWHYGYAVCLSDVLKLLGEGAEKN